MLKDNLERILQEFIPHSASYCIPDLVKAILELVEKEIPKEIVKINEECDKCLNGSKCKVCGVQYFNQSLAQIKRRIGG